MKFYIFKQGNIASKSVHHSAHFFKDVETILYEIYVDCCGSVFRLREPPPGNGVKIKEWNSMNPLPPVYWRHKATSALLTGSILLRLRQSTIVAVYACWSPWLILNRSFLLRSITGKICIND